MKLDLNKALEMKSLGWTRHEIMAALPCSLSWYSKNVGGARCDPKLQDGEILKDIDGQEGKYAVTSLGRVWSYKTSLWLRPTPSGKGYFSVCLSDQEHNYLHRLVATAFIENSECKATVNHINGVKSDNRLDNLEWATQKEQVDHAIDTGLNKLVGEDNGYAMLNDAKVTQIRTKYYSGQYTHEQLGNEYGVTRACILKVVRGRSWKHLPFNKAIANEPCWGSGLRRNSNLTVAIAEEIRARYIAGGCSHRSLAKEYLLTASTIRSVIHKTSWVDSLTPSQLSLMLAKAA